MPADVSLVARALRHVTDDDLRELVGEASLRRGRAYTVQRRVSGLKVLGPNTLTATVRGQGHTYSTAAEIAEDGCVLGGHCTCPIGADCKHVVAVVLTARQTLGLAGAAPARTVVVQPAPAPPSWERVLGGVLTAASAASATQYTPLGLLVEVREPRTGPYVTHSTGNQPRLALRPLVPGKTGWIKTGISWSTLDHLGYGHLRIDPRQKDALQRLAAAGGTSYRYYSQPEWLDLDLLDEGWPTALRLCRRAGVELLTAQRGGGQVILADEPATVSLDLTRTTDGGVRLTPSISVPDQVEQAADPSVWFSIGSPPTGVWSRHTEDLRLAAFEPALDLETFRVLQHGPVDVPPQDVGRFLTGAVPVLAKRFVVESSDGGVEITEAAAPELCLRVTHLPELRLGLEWSWRYAVGADAVVLRLGSVEHHALRDAAAEKALVAAVTGLDLPPAVAEPATFGDPARLRPTAMLSGFDVVTFLDGVLPLLDDLAGVEVVVDGDPVVYTEAPEPPTIRLSVTECADDHDWFDLGIEVHVGSEDVPIAALVRAFALGEQQVILATGTWFRVDRPELAELQRLIEEARALQDVQRGPLRLSAYHADLWAELETLGVVDEQSERWARLVKGLREEGTEAVAAPDGLRATLRPYQHEGFEWLTFLRRHGLGGILADDMGLGKTVQALAMILTERGERTSEVPSDGAALFDPADAPGSPCSPDTTDTPGSAVAPWLVVAPASVLAVWEAEAARFAPDLRVTVLPSTSTRRGACVAEAIGAADVVVTSYAVFRLDAEEFRDVRWAGLVLDEAQVVKNHQSVTYQCARRLSAATKFAITGTPMENNLMELWSLLSIVAPGLFPHPKAFTDHYRRPIETGAEPERLATLRRRIRPVMLRRTKAAVAVDLPAKQEQVVQVELPPRHRRLYDRGLARERQRVLGLLEDAGHNQIAIFRALTLLRQLSLHPSLVDDEHVALPCAKIDRLVEMLEPVLAEGHRALVFSQFTSFLAMVRKRLDADGISYSYLDGRTRRRQEAVEQFRSGQRQVFLISLKAGGVGLTLTEADYVFLLDPWWNPAVEAQAVDRTHRIGQDKQVFVYRLVSGETIEEKVVALQERKRALFSTVVDEGALASGSLSADDIRGLL